MKCKVKGKDFIAAVKTVLAVHDFGESSDPRQPCLLTADEDKLTVESAKLGAYIVKSIPGSLLRPGTVGLNAKDLTGMKLKGEVTIDGSDHATTFFDKNARYQWANDDRADEEIHEQRDALSEVKAVAKIPSTLMRAGSTFATYKSETGDYDVQVTIEPKRFEYIGLDYLGSARYEFKAPNVKAKSPVHFVLGTSLIGKVMQHVSSEDMVIGISDDESTVRMKTDDLDLFHPTIDKPYMASSKMIAAVTKSEGAKCICQFTVDCKEFKTAIERVVPIGKKGTESTIEILIDPKKGVLLKLAVMDNKASSKMDVSDLKIGKKPITLMARTQYLQEFVKAAPSVPLTVQSWNGKFLRMMVTEDKSFIDYMAQMVSD